MPQAYSLDIPRTACAPCLEKHNLHPAGGVAGSDQREGPERMIVIARQGHRCRSDPATQRRLRIGGFVALKIGVAKDFEPVLRLWFGQSRLEYREARRWQGRHGIHRIESNSLKPLKDCFRRSGLAAGPITGLPHGRRSGYFGWPF